MLSYRQLLFFIYFFFRFADMLYMYTVSYRNEDAVDIVNHLNALVIFKNYYIVVCYLKPLNYAVFLWEMID